MTVDPGSPGLRVFLSYRRATDLAYALRLHDFLTQRIGTESVFFDLHTLGPGSEFPTAIAEAIADSDVLIALIGPTWSTVAEKDGRRRLDDPADFVRRELEEALEHKIRIVPVLVGEAKMPGVADLPPTLHRFAARNAVELPKFRWDAPVDDLVRVMTQLVRSDREHAKTSTGSGARPESTFGQFRLDKLLKTQDLAEYHRAYDTVGRRDVTVEVLPQALSDDPGIRDRFRYEAATITALAGPQPLPPPGRHLVDCSPG